MTNSNSSRIAGLDLMKALGLYLVIVYHLIFRFVPETMPDALLPRVFYGFYPLLGICVPLFFTASGALSLTRPINLKKNCFRALHLLILLIFWSFFSLLMVYAIRREWPGLRPFLKNAWELPIGTIQHLWYMPTFLFLTLLMPVLHTLRQSSRTIWRYGLLVLAVFTFGNKLLADGECLLRWVLGRGGSFTGNRSYFGYVNFFNYHYWYAPIYLALGAWLLERREALRPHWRKTIGVILICGASLGLIAHARSYCQGYVSDPVFNGYGDPFTLGLTGAVSLLLLNAAPGKKLQKVARNLSDCSLGVYLVHWLLIEVLLVYFPGLTQRLYLAPVTALAVLAVSWGLTWCLRRIPVIQYLFTAAPGYLKKIS